MNITFSKWVYLLAGALVVFAFYFFYTSTPNKPVEIPDQTVMPDSPDYSDTSEKDKTIKELSFLLNLASNKIGKLSCNISDDVSENGGWCSKISGKNSPQHATDLPLALELSKYLKGKRTASFGDGPGIYRDLFLKYGDVLCYDAFDGAPFAEETTNNSVKFLDLSIPIYHIDKYDWIISLEVAEHIPKQFENVYVNNVARHATEGVILSWAKIGQGGHSHVNNKDFNDVKKIFEEKGFIHDPNDSQRFKNIATLGWLKDNLNIYKKNSSQK